MSGIEWIRHGGGGAKIPALLLVLMVLSACASSDRFGGGQPDQVTTPAPPAATPPAPAPPQPPPIDLAGRWRLSMAGGGACLMTFGANPGASDGPIAPAGGCPGNFYTSRKWTFEHGMLILRDHKSEVLVELAFANGHFEGKVTNGGSITLARP